jgi:hypothetical protein
MPAAPSHIRTQPAGKSSRVPPVVRTRHRRDGGAEKTTDVFDAKIVVLSHRRSFQVENTAGVPQAERWWLLLELMQTARSSMAALARDHAKTRGIMKAPWWCLSYWGTTRFHVSLRNLAALVTVARLTPMAALPWRRDSHQGGVVFNEQT